MKKTLLFILLFASYALYSQNISGILLSTESKKPIEFANIGIVGKNVGTVSDKNGRFSLTIDSQYDNDTVLFSIIGYKSLFIIVSELRIKQENVIILQEKDYEITEILVKPKKIRQKTLGVRTKLKSMAAGFDDNFLGYECGILMKVKKKAYLKKVNINIAVCSYDTIFYRLNIYKANGKMDFQNILNEPIYITMPKKLIKDGIQIDLQSKNLVVEGDFLITLEHVKNLGDGKLHFCAGLTDKTYFRKTSQGKWETAPIGISISVIADVEK